ncbi:hypothetical protein [Halobacteriovorax sp.]|uniref:hypothetical protein n=1 Tax=Halobacteriovorax sp. TaxID=2020862 RepID=UPI003565A56C
MKYIVLFTLLVSLNAKAQDLKKLKSNSFWVESNHIEPFDFDTFLLKSFKGSRLELICSDNPFLGNKHSYIKYTNIYGIHVKDFLFKDEFQCHSFKKFINSVFPAINENNSVKIQFNKNDGSVEKILLPDLDIYENGDSYYKDVNNKEMANI